MMKKEYIEPRMKMLIPNQENLMGFDLTESEAGDGFEYAKEDNEFNDEPLPKMKSVWDEEF